MLSEKKSLFFEKNTKSISSTFQIFEKKYLSLVNENLNYIIPKKYNWDFIASKYIETIHKLTRFQSK